MNNNLNNNQLVKIYSEASILLIKQDITIEKCLKAMAIVKTYLLNKDTTPPETLVLAYSLLASIINEADKCP
jgi:hypothetical protein